MNTRAWRVAFAVAFAAATWLLLSPQTLDPVPGRAGVDKLGHALLFATLALLALPAFPGIAGWRIFAALAAYGAATELTQGFVPGRTPELLDVAADIAGAAIALVRTRTQKDR